MLQERQVVAGIAVEINFFVVGLALAAFGQPLVQAGYFTLLEAGRAYRAAGVVAFIIGFKADADDVFNAEFAGDGGDDEFVGGGNQQQGVTGITVAIDQHSGHLGDTWADALHKLAVHFVQLGAAVFGQRAQDEGEIGIEIEAAFAVVLVERLVALHIGIAEDAFFVQEITPFAAGIAVDEGVVEVEDGEVHWFKYSVATVV